MSKTPEKKQGWLTRCLNGIERVGNALPHPVTLFAIMALAVVVISAICAAPMILARLGILDGKKCTCYPSCSDELPSDGFIKDAGVVSDGEIITGRAAGDALDFAFAILSTLRGEEVAESVKCAVCYDKK